MARQRLNRALGRGVGVGPLSTSQFKYVGSFGVGSMLLFMLGAEFIVVALAFSCTTAAWISATGDNPGEFWDERKKPKRWIQDPQEMTYTSYGFPQGKVRRKEVFNKSDKSIMTTQEGTFPLTTYFEYRKDVTPVGAYLLQRRSIVKVVFCFEVEGITPSIDDDAAASWLENISEGIRQLPDVSLRIHLPSESKSEHVINSIILDEDDGELEYAFNASRRERFRALGEQGVLQERKIKIYATFTTSFGTYSQPKGWFQSLTLQGAALLQGWTPSEQKLYQTLSAVYEFGYRAIEETLQDTSRFALKVVPKAAEELWEDDWERFHDTPAPPIPQCPIVTQDRLDNSIKNSPMHPISLLFSPEKGIASVPVTDKGSIFLPAKNKFVGGVSFGRLEAYPTKGGYNKAKLGYLHEIMKDSSDYEVIVEINPQNSQITDKVQMQRTFNNAVGRQSTAIAKGKIDENAKRTGQEAAEAIAALEDGSRSTYVSGCVWFKRSSTLEIQSAVDRIVRSMPDGSEYIKNCAEYWWNQSQPFSWDQLGRTPTDRRQKYFSHQLIGLLPLMAQQPLDDKGFTLVAKDGTPCQTNITEGKNHALVVATSRAGKSILLIEIIFDFYTKGYPVLVYDFPRPDGTSTYTPLIKVINQIGGSAAYFNVEKETINGIEWPHLEDVETSSVVDTFDPDEVEVDKAVRRMNQVFSSHIDLIKLVVLGNLDDSLPAVHQASLLLEQSYRAFCDDPYIKQERAAAAKAPFGSEGRKRMPILPDYVDFAIAWLAHYINKMEEQLSKGSAEVRPARLLREASEIISTSLLGILSTKVGRAIGGHSTVDGSSRLIIAALTNVSSDLETAIYATAVDTLLVRRAMQSRYSAEIVDEGSILFENPTFASNRARKAANGHKWGLHLIIACQTMSSILKMKNMRDELLQNIGTKLIGWIQSDAVDDLLTQKFQPDLVRNMTKSPPSPEKARSYWYIKRGDQHIEACHYPGKFTLAIGANDPDENDIRKLYLQSNPQDPIAALFDFSDALNHAKKTNTPIAPPSVSDDELAARQLTAASR